MLRRAFTLIELLVVIAIIAILAAILFPVFAQAKSAAKDTVALSNAKELGLSAIMYAGDVDDVFPLAIRTDGNGWDSWQGLCQPYMKSWGIDLHPKVKNPPTDTASVGWYYQVRQHWGMPLRAAANSSATNGYYEYVSGSMTGGVPTKFDGIGGYGWDGDPSHLYYGTYGVNSGSYSTSQINNVSDMVLITEANDPDMSWSYLPQASGSTGPMNYWLSWNSTEVSPWGSTFTYCGPHSRKNPIKCDGSNNGSGGIQSICTGNLPWPDGRTTYVATDGSAKSVPWRGGITQKIDADGGRVALKRLWPQ